MALSDQQFPHPGAVQRRPGQRKGLGDLRDRVASRPQPQHLITSRRFGWRDPRARASLDEELTRLRGEVADHRHHARGRITEPCGDLRGSGVLDEVRAQRLVATLRHILRGREEPGAVTPPPRSTTRTGALR